MTAATGPAELAGTIQPRSFGVMFDPPTLTLVYSIDSKLRKRTMPVRRLTAESDPADLAARLVRTHPSLLAPNVVSPAQLERLVAKLIAHKREEDRRERSASQPPQSLPLPAQHREGHEAVAAATAAAPGGVPPSAAAQHTAPRTLAPLPPLGRGLRSGDDGGRSSDEEPSSPPAAAASRAAETRRGAGGAGGRSERRGEAATNGEPDLDVEDLLAALDEEDGSTTSPFGGSPFGGSPSMPARSAAKSGPAADAHAGTQQPRSPLSRPAPTVDGAEGAAALSSVLDGIAGEGGDLNKVRRKSSVSPPRHRPACPPPQAPSTLPAPPHAPQVGEAELAEAKAAMAVDFERNRVAPGDAGYVHDRRVDFSGEKEENAWDESISDFSSEADETDALKELLKGI